MVAQGIAKGVIVICELRPPCALLDLEGIPYALSNVRLGDRDCGIRGYEPVAGSTDAVGPERRGSEGDLVLFVLDALECARVESVSPGRNS